MLREFTDEVIGQIVRIIVESLDPDQIVLFGSRARGTAGPHSDVDLLIVDSGKPADNRSRKEKLTTLWRLLSQLRMPFDLLLFSGDEMEKWRGSRYHIIGTALREGRLIYERT